MWSDTSHLSDSTPPLHHHHNTNHLAKGVPCLLVFCLEILHVHMSICMFSLCCVWKIPLSLHSCMLLFIQV